VCLARRAFFFFEKKEWQRPTVKKNTFCAASAVRNDPLKNFAFDIFHDINIGVAKFYNGLHKKYMEPLVLISKPVTN
jgi:hypothetical protein